MGNKKIFELGEANEWFRRNQASLEENKTDEAISLLCEWLQPFKSEIEEVLEVGCGSGHRLNQMTESLKSMGYGVEPSAEAVNYISQSFPLLQAKIGFGDDVPFTKNFDLVHLGFFLYLVDREFYMRCVSEADRLVKFGGFLSIIDFETPYPFSNKYTHKEGARSYKQNNSDVFCASGLYSVVNKFHFSHTNFSFDKEVNERVSLTLLYKETNAYPLKK
jgi:SAM-dependent methyltransferase